MSLTGLTGNRAVRDRLTKMIVGGRIPPSMLFTGPPGVGKRLAALNLAKALNCTGEAEPGDACDQCPACLRIDRDEFADVRTVRPEGTGGQVKAEAVRQVVSESPFRPFEGKKRVYLFEEADRMNPTAANSLLKTLEEPPPWTLLVLITSQEAGILPTLLSRCQKIRFLPLSADEVMKILLTRHGVDPEAARLAAAISGGSVSRALAFQGEDLEGLRHEALRLAQVLVDERPSPAKLLRRADALSKHPRLADVLRLLLALLRDVTARMSGVPVFQSDLDSELGSLASRASLACWLEAYLAAEQALHDIDVRYANKRITLENLLLCLSELGSQPAGERPGLARAGFR